MIDRTKVNYFIDMALLISFFTCFYTGILKLHGIVNIIGAAAYKILYFRNLTLVHDISGIILGVLVFIHLMLHQTWMLAVTRKIFWKKI